MADYTADFLPRARFMGRPGAALMQTVTRLRPFWCVIALVCLLVQSSLVFANASVNEIPWTGQRFRYTATQKNLNELLVEFGVANGVNIVAAPELDRVVSVRFDDPPQVVLNSLASSYGLIWFFDGSVLYVEPATSARTEVIRMAYGKVEELLAVLKRIKIPEGRYRLNADTEQNLIIVSGPARYVDLVKSISVSLDQSQASRRQSTVRVFPLRRAWAADFRVRQQGKDIEMPGVVSLLRKLYSPQAKRSDDLGASGLLSRIADMRLAIPEAAQQGGADKKGLSPRSPLSGFGQPSRPAPVMPPNEPGLPSFEADPNSNSVLVRDYWDRIEQYAKVIDKLDQGSGLIEIEVSIMDISSSALTQLGMDWSLYSSRIGASTGFASNGSSFFAQEFPDTKTVRNVGKGLVANAVLGAGQNRLISRVYALEESGQGRIVARPKVLTMNNVEAVLENTDTFYVKSEGQYSSNLFDVTAGTTVRVMPLILNQGDATGVKLAITIEDGGILDQSDQSIPRIKRSSINTQAVVSEGESVLLAGYSRDEQKRNQAGLPWVARLPVLGNLFGYTANQTTRSERYYLVTPRILRANPVNEREAQDER